MHQIDAIFRVEPGITDLEWFNVDGRTGSEAHLTSVLD
jgi:hypothetical protein